MSGSTPNLRQGLPLPSVPLVDLDSGAISGVWLDFLMQLWRRTGSGLGPSPSSLTPADPSQSLLLDDVQDAPADPLLVAFAVGGAADSPAPTDPSQSLLLDDVQDVPPIASTTVAGVVKVDGLSVTISGGVLSASGVSAGVSGFNSRTGAVTLSSADVVSALTFAPYPAANPSGFIAATGAPVQSVATRTGAVTLTHADITDWGATTSGYGVRPLALLVNGDIPVGIMHDQFGIPVYVPQ